MVCSQGLAGTVVQSPLNCQVSKQTLCYWNRRICFPLGFKAICAERREFSNYQIMKLSLLKQEGRGSKGIEILSQWSGFAHHVSRRKICKWFQRPGINVCQGRERDASRLPCSTHHVSREQLCCCILPLIILMPDSSLKYQKSVATGFWP